MIYLVNNKKSLAQVFSLCSSDDEILCFYSSQINEIDLQKAYDKVNKIYIVVNDDQYLNYEAFAFKNIELNSSIINTTQACELIFQAQKVISFLDEYQ